MTLARTRGRLYGELSLFVVFQWVGSEILHSFSRHSDGVSSSGFLLGSSLSLLCGSCHVCIMPQATTPHLLDCVSRSPTFREPVQPVDATPSDILLHPKLSVTVLLSMRYVNYTIEAKYPGFKTKQLKNVFLGSHSGPVETAYIEIQLQPAQTITVY